MMWAWLDLWVEHVMMWVCLDRQVELLMWAWIDWWVELVMMWVCLDLRVELVRVWRWVEGKVGRGGRTTSDTKDTAHWKGHCQDLEEAREIQCSFSRKSSQRGRYEYMTQDS